LTKTICTSTCKGMIHIPNLFYYTQLNIEKIPWPDSVEIP
jgi:hypothetical protein